jgi:hypothetical protein
MMNFTLYYWVEMRFLGEELMTDQRLQNRQRSR